jgi:hypothetical protein
VTTDELQQLKDEVFHKVFAKSFQRHDECWVWLGARQKKSRLGVITIRRRQFTASRASAWVMGDLDLWDTDIRVLHLCREPACVNPEHLVCVGGGKAGMAAIINRWRRRDRQTSGLRSLVMANSRN